MFTNSQRLRSLVKKISSIVTTCAIYFCVITSAQGVTEVSIENIDSARFPTIYSNVTVTSDGSPTDNLTIDQFTVREDGPVQQIENVTPPGSSAGDRRADVVFVVDVSGSMGGEIADVRSNINSFASALASSGVEFALGLVDFGASSGPNPRIYNDGNLTSDVTEFQSLVDTLRATGGYEPGFLALRQAATQFVFRAGAQKIFLIITDEDSDDRNKADTIRLLQAANVTVHAAVQCNSGSSNSDYCNDTSVRAATGGLLFGVQGPYAPILDTIAEATGATYIVRYTTDNPVNDGLEREVEIEAVVDGMPGSGLGYYIPGSAPKIALTPEAVELVNVSALQGTTLAISADIQDDVLPGVDEARLYYRWADPTNVGFSSASMSQVGSTTTWTADIPPSAVLSPGVEFYIKATDGQSTSSFPSEEPSQNPQNIAVLPNEAPSITLIAPPMPLDTHTVGQPLNVRAEIADSTNRIATAAVYYRKAGDLGWSKLDHPVPAGAQETELDVDIPAGVVTGTALEFYISATDDLGITRLFPIAGPDEPVVVALQDKQPQALFIPGIMGSSLFERRCNPEDVNDYCRRWIRFDDDEVLKLKMLPSGAPLAEMYVKEEIGNDEEFEGVRGGLVTEGLQPTPINTYKGFILDKFAIEGGSGDGDPNRLWNVFTYDWRLQFDAEQLMEPDSGICSVVETEDDGVCRKGLLESLRAKLVELARRDPQGRVDIVAHSTGGLLAKYYLADPRYRENSLVKNLVLVAVPQYGTPGGAWALMHGEHGLTEWYAPLAKDTLREVSQYMTTAFTLAPSREYFDTDRLRNLSKGLFHTRRDLFLGTGCDELGYIEEFDRRFPQGIRSVNSWAEFVRDPGLMGTTDLNASSRPLAGDPARVEILLDASDIQNRIGEYWSAPDGVKVSQLVGVNLDTPVAMAYQEINTRAVTVPCSDEFKYIPLSFAVGDGTVVDDSADALRDREGVFTVYFDLNTYNCNYANEDHASILQVTPVVDQIDEILSAESWPPRLVWQDDEDLLDPCNSFWRSNVEIAATDKAGLQGIVDTLKIEIKSPVEVHVYDSSGRHTGPSAYGPESQIPNSRYREVDGKKYVTLPNGFDEYVVELTGTGEGTFSVSIERYIGTELSGVVDFLNIPVELGQKNRMQFKYFEDIETVQEDKDGDGVYESVIERVSRVDAKTKGANFRDGRYGVVANLRIRANLIDDVKTGSGKFVVREPGQGNAVEVSKIEFDQIESLRVEPGSQVVVSTPCRRNKQDGFKCSLTLFDGGHPGVGKDGFAIEVLGNDGYIYRNAGTISGGDIRVVVE